MTAMTEITRSGTKAARGLVTIQSRLNQTQDASSSTGKKLIEWYKEHNIEIMENEDTMKSFYDIAGDVAEIWNELSDSERRYYLNIQAGANQTQNLAALLRNYSTVVGATNDAIKSNNSAQEENAKYLDSIEGRLKGLSTEWEKLSHSVVNSDLIKGSISFLTNAVKAVEKVRDTIGTLPTAILAVIGAAKGLKLMQTLLVGLPEQIAEAGGAISMLTGISVPGAGNMGLVAQIRDARIAYQGLRTTVNEYHGALRNVELAELAAMDARSKSGDAIRAARQELGLTSRAEAEAVAIDSRIALSEIEATGEAAEAQIARANAGLQAVSKSLFGIVAVTATIVLAKKMYEVYQHSHDVRTILEDIQDIESEIADKESEINQLLAKRDAGKITKEEENNLKLLEAQVRVLKLRNQLEKKKLRQAFKEDVFTLGETGTTGELDEYERKVKLLASEIEKLAELREKLDDPMSMEALDELTQQIEDQQKLVDEMSISLGEYGTALGEEYVGMVEAGLSREDFTGEYLEAFDRMHAAFLTSQLDAEALQDDYIKVFDTLSGAINRFKFDGIIDFDKIDISKIKEIDDLTKQIQKQFKKLPDNTDIDITATDKTGKVLGDISAKKNELTKEEWNLIIEAQTTGDWSKVEKFEATDETTTKFLEIQADLKEGKKKNGQDPLNPEVTFTVHSKDVDNKNKELSNIASKGYTIDVTYRYQGEGGPPFATGKRKGEPGGMALLGDEKGASSTNPKPELVVGEDGAYLAGTSGLEFYPVKSSDTVYTYAQTKKLLGGKMNYQFGASEIPRFAKGKSSNTYYTGSEGFAKKESKRISGNIDRWEFQLDLGLISQEQYLKKLEKLLNKRKKLTQDQYRDLAKIVADGEREIAQNTAQALASQVEYGDVSYEKALNELRTLKDKLGKEEFKEAKISISEADFNRALEQYREGVIGYEKLESAAKRYFNVVGKGSAEAVEAQHKINEAVNETNKKLAEGINVSLKYQYINYDDSLSQLENFKNKLSPEDFAEMQRQLSETNLDNLIAGFGESINKVDKLKEALREFIALVGEGTPEAIEATHRVDEAVHQAAVDVYNDMLDLRGIGKATAQQVDDAFEEAYGNMDKNSKEYHDAEKRRVQADVNLLNHEMSALQQTLSIANSILSFELDMLNKIKEKRDEIREIARKAQEKAESLAELETEQKEAQVNYERELVELQNELTKSQSKTIKVYKEGIGWVYEKDVESVRKAQLDIVKLNEDYAKELEDFAKRKEEILTADEEEEEDWLDKKIESLTMAMSAISALSSLLGIATSIVSLGQMLGGFATGKKPGEPGGIAWVGDEMKPGSKQPKPEMIVHKDGTAQLAGTQGWELVNLKSSDAVYTYDQTKKLLGEDILGGIGLFNGAKNNLLNEVQMFGKGYIPSYSNNHNKDIDKQMVSNNNYTYNFDKIELPNVVDANSFVNELKNLPTLAIQMTGRR